MKAVKLARFLIPLMLLPGAADAQQLPKQKFICNAGYSQQECHRQFAVLRPVLARFHADAVGEWSWVLVRSSDWKALAYRLGLNPDSPAFSALDTRVTFFEEVLVEPKPARCAELMRIWHMPINHLLDEAVTHELGHALSQGSNEARAERRAQSLQRAESPAASFGQ